MRWNGQIVVFNRSGGASLGMNGSKDVKVRELVNWVCEGGVDIKIQAGPLDSVPGVTQGCSQSRHGLGWAVLWRFWGIICFQAHLG